MSSEMTPRAGSPSELDGHAAPQSSTGEHDGAHSANSLNNDNEKATNDPNAAPDGGFRAWIVAAGFATIFFCTLGLSNSFGIFQEYYMTHQLMGESASNISWIGSTQSFFQFFTGMIAGPLFDRYGALVRILPSLYAAET